MHVARNIGQSVITMPIHIMPWKRKKIGFNHEKKGRKKLININDFVVSASSSSKVLSSSVNCASGKKFPNLSSLMCCVVGVFYSYQGRMEVKLCTAHTVSSLKFCTLKCVLYRSIDTLLLIIVWGKWSSDLKWGGHLALWKLAQPAEVKIH